MLWDGISRRVIEPWICFAQEQAIDTRHRKDAVCIVRAKRHVKWTKKSRPTSVPVFLASYAPTDHSYHLTTIGSFHPRALAQLRRFNNSIPQDMAGVNICIAVTTRAGITSTYQCRLTKFWIPTGFSDVQCRRTLINPHDGMKEDDGLVCKPPNSEDYIGGVVNVARWAVGLRNKTCSG